MNDSLSNEIHSNERYFYRLRYSMCDFRWLNDPQFVGSFETEDHVYFLFRESAVEYINCGKVIKRVRPLHSLVHVRTFDIKRWSLLENLFEDSKSVQERSRWTNNDERGMDDVQQGTIELFPSRRISFLLRRNPRRGLSSRGKNRLCDVYHAHVSNINTLLHRIVPFHHIFPSNASLVKEKEEK